MNPLKATLTPTTPFPIRYTRSFSDQGNEIWGVYTLANEPETPHRHIGGVLFAKAQPIKVTYLSGEEFVLDRIGSILEDIPLPKSEMHFATTPSDYKAVFIELKTRAAITTPKANWIKPPFQIDKSVFGSECDNLTIENNAELQTSEREAFLVTETAMKVDVFVNDKIMPIHALPNLPHHVYYLPPNQHYKLSVTGKIQALLLEP